jgi:hypothetical protein
MLGCEQRQVNEESRGTVMMDAELMVEVQVQMLCGSAPQSSITKYERDEWRWCLDK